VSREQRFQARFFWTFPAGALWLLSGCGVDPISEEDFITTGGASGGEDEPGGSGGRSATGGKTATGGSSSGTGGSTPEKPKPSAGRWLFIGQDTVSIDAYAEAVGTPPGIVSYTSLKNLEGLTTVDDHGGGPNHLLGSANRYPEARVAIGLYLVDYLPTVNGGGADSQIDSLAGILRDLDRPVLLRIGYEFDAEWTSYPPEAYVSAYKRIFEGIRDAGAEQVSFVWQSAALCNPRFMNQPLSAWYPGDDLVDWVGLSYFRPEACNFQVVNEVVDFARGKGKKVFIAEATPQGYDLAEETFSYDGQQRAARSGAEIWNQWFSPFFRFIDDNDDVISAVSYINADWDTQGLWAPPYPSGYWGDTRVQANAEVLSRFQNELARPEWGLSP
jgi:endo-1,3-beta-xylanase